MELPQEVMDAWVTYRTDLRPETRNDFLVAMFKAFPVRLHEGHPQTLLDPSSIPVIQEEPNPRFTPEGRVAYPPLTIEQATEKHFIVEGDHYGYNGLDGFIPKGSIKPCEA